MTHNLARAFADHARRGPERLALSVDDSETSYGELARRAAAIAGFLRASARPQPQPQDAPGREDVRVAILTARSLTAFSSILGTAWAGFTYVPINPKLPEDRLIGLLQRARVSAVLADEAGSARLTDAVLAHAPACVVAPRAAMPSPSARVTDWTEVLAHGPLAEPAPKDPSSTGYVLFTSGTTGTPKGVMVSAGSVRAFVDGMQKRFELSPDDRFSQHPELTFDLSVFDMFTCWSSGASLHVVPDGQRMAPLRFIAEHAVTVWLSVPSVIAFVERMKMLAPGMLPSLRYSLFCGEPLPAAAARAWKAATPNGIVENHYGPTEATVAITAQLVDEPMRVTEERGCVAIGPPYPGQYAAIIDEAGKFLAVGERGELALGGSQLMTGYFDDDALTASRCPVLEHPELGATRWYRTGDLACMDADGTFHHLGRIDNQIKLRGYRIELEDIEAHLRAVASSTAVCAVPWPVEQGIVQGVTAFVTGTKLSRGEILEGIKARLPEYMVPKSLFVVDELPLSSSGKIDRKALLAKLAAGAAPAGA